MSWTKQTITVDIASSCPTSRPCRPPAAGDPQGRRQGPALSAGAARRCRQGAAHRRRAVDGRRPAARSQGHAHVALRRNPRTAAPAARRPGLLALLRRHAAAARCAAAARSSSLSPTSSARPRRSPASRACSTTTCGCARQREGRTAELTIEVVAPVTSLCPCSKEISDYGAHNQRSHITISARLRADEP
jgi:hypothetical protein